PPSPRFGHSSRPDRPAPIQLPLFAEAASLIRVRPERNEWRFYRMEICPPPAIPSASPAEPSPAPPDLFGRALLLEGIASVVM
ncbi:MAG TPA: hypothetical protein VGL95_18410, partial [Acetobacteraceae bacterium]